MLCAVGMLRASGALDFLLDGIRWLAAQAGWDARFVDALPTARSSPFPAARARADAGDHDALRRGQLPRAAGHRGASSTETTFYVLAVYFGSVGILRARHAVACAGGRRPAIGVCYWFFG